MKNKNYKIFLDMDGVSVDFDGTWKKEFGFDLNDWYAITMNSLQIDNNFEEASDTFNQMFWDTMMKKPNFFINAKPMKNLFFLKLFLRNEPYSILTALPNRKYVKWEEILNIKIQKEDWAAKHFKKRKIDFANLCVGGDGSAISKNEFITHDVDCILIDDNLKNIEAWRKGGGLGIHHTSIFKTIKELRGLIHD